MTFGRSPGRSKQTRFVTNLQHSQKFKAIMLQKVPRNSKTPQKRYVPEVFSGDPPGIRFMFACGKHHGFARSGPRDRQSTGLSDLDYSSPIIPPAEKEEDTLRYPLSLSKKLSESWAFSVLYDIIVPGDERCWNEEKWNVESLRS